VGASERSKVRMIEEAREKECYIAAWEFLSNEILFTVMMTYAAIVGYFQTGEYLKIDFIFYFLILN